jgi:hypothetical protein
VSDVPTSKGWLQSQLSTILENDFLAPVVANLFFRDLPQSIMPIQLMPDRAATLEQAFEQAWREACDKREYSPTCADNNQFSKSFFDIRKDSGWNPVLLLNGTHQETGKRIVTSHVRIDQNVFFDAYDFFDLTRHDVALSTAVLNSARFPIISPAGALIKSSAFDKVELRGHIIDGGFFENNGAVTLLEMAKAILQKLNEKSNDKSQEWKPLVIEIINDVEMGEDDLARRTNSPFEGRSNAPLAMRSTATAQSNFANQLVSAAEGLYATRTARGILAAKNLADFTHENRGQFVQFRLCSHMKPAPPLGWLLTSESRKAMDHLILGHSRTEFLIKYANSTGANSNVGKYLKCFAEIQQRLAFVQRILRSPNKLLELTR